MLNDDQDESLFRLGVRTHDDPPGDFLEAVTAMTRFLDMTSSAPMFEQFGVTALADWTLLMVLRFEPQGLTGREVFRIIGMRMKRFRQLTDRLVREGLVRIEEKNKLSSVVITPSGEERLKVMNANLELVLAEFSKKHPKDVSRIGKRLRTLSRMYDRVPSEEDDC